MLARWFDRNGIGQVLAPDEKVAKEPEPDETTSTFWQIVAPDPNFEPPKAPPADAFIAVPSSENQVLCEHCNRWTNLKTPRSTPKKSTIAEVSTPITKKAPTGISEQLFTPPPKVNSRYSSSELESLVLSAAKDTAFSMSSPPHVQESRDKVFRLCGSQKPINPKLVKRLRNLLTKDPSLIHCRATGLGQLVPDGFTPLMACSHADHVVAAEVIIELSPTAVFVDRDLQGRTALHIAAELGHVNMITLLQSKSPQGLMKSPQPLDLLGRTPLGRAVTSPNPTARKRQKELQQKLYSAGDLSVFGVSKPESERSGKIDDLQLSYGVSDMPGMRVIMEDSVCCSSFEKDGKSFFLIGVCDGHGDRGHVSKFIAENAPTVLQENLSSDPADWPAIWSKTCLELDEKLKKEGINGGTTAVLALITKELIVVANLGDSRAVLVRKSPMEDLEKKVESMALTDSGDGTSAPSEESEQKEPPKNEGVSVIALSDDHKPNLQNELARIEKAGMKVVSVTFEENGKDVTIHKVQKTDSEQLALSRAFGDFEYKLNTTLGPEEQAISALPDVKLQTRDPDNDMYLVLACDGVWDVMENEAVKDFVLTQVENRVDNTDALLTEVGDALLLESLNNGSKDNLTAVIVALSKESDKVRPVIAGKTLDFS